MCFISCFYLLQIIIVQVVMFSYFMVGESVQNTIVNDLTLLLLYILLQLMVIIVA